MHFLTHNLTSDPAVFRHGSSLAPRLAKRHLFCVFVEKFASRAARLVEKNGGGHWSARAARPSPPTLASLRAHSARCCDTHTHKEGSCLVVASPVRSLGVEAWELFERAVGAGLPRRLTTQSVMS